MNNEELEAIRDRVDKAREYGEGVDVIVFGDVPKLLAEIERLRAQNSELLEWNRYYLAENKRLKRGGDSE